MTSDIPVSPPVPTLRDPTTAVQTSYSRLFDSITTAYCLPGLRFIGLGNWKVVYESES